MSSISWVAIDLTLTTSVALGVADDRGDDRVRFGGVAGPVDDAAGRRDVGLELVQKRRQSCMTSSLMAAPACRSSSQSARSAMAADRLVRMVAVARPRLVRSCSSASAARAASGKAGCRGRSVRVSGSSWRPSVDGQDLGEVHDPHRRLLAR